MSNLEWIEELQHQLADSNKKVERLRTQLDELQNEKNNLCNDIVDLNLTIENKEKQLNEANMVILSLPAEKISTCMIACEYLDKWGVK